MDKDTEEKNKLAYKLLFSTAGNVYNDIIHIKLPELTISRISVKDDDIMEENLNQKWSDYKEWLASTIIEQDLPRFVRYTEEDVILNAEPGDHTTMNYRSNAFREDGTIRLYFSAFRFFKDEAFFLTVDETVESTKRERIADNDLLNGDQYKKAIISDAIQLYEFNITKNRIIGNPIQHLGERIIKLLDAYGLDEDCTYTEFIENLSWDMGDDEKQKFLKKMDIKNLMESFLRGEYETWFDSSKLSLDGEAFWTRTTVILTKDPQSSDIKGLAVVKNITKNYTNEEERLYQKEIIHGLTNDYSNVYMINLFSSKITTIRIKDELGAFYTDAMSNQRYEDAFDFFVNVSVYNDDRDMMSHAFSRENIIRQLQTKESYYANFRTFINGKISYMKIKVVRIGGEIDKNFNILMAFMNVDDEIEHEMIQRKMLQEALGEAESANRAKTQFLSSMSHDIRTPMNAIVGFTTIAETHLNEPEQIKSYLSKIKSSSNHLLNLINDVLDMSRIESGKMKIQNTTYSIDQIINDVDNVIQQQAKLKNLDYRIDRRGNLSKSIICDNLRVNQVLINILSNAVKYTKDNGAVTFTVEELPSKSEAFSTYRFTCTDTGIGMSDDFQKKLFQTFEREETSDTRMIQGTGLGLAITKNLVDLMNGTITATSKQGSGSEFVVTFEFENSRATEQKSISKFTGNVDLEKFKGTRLLLVEDNELNRDIARELLKQVGFIIEEAENGQEGLDKVKENPAGYYKTVLMDVQMPVMNGYEATIAIRELEDEDKKKIPIIAMTANAFEEDKKNAQRAGMDSYISKPFDIKDLLQKIAALLEKNHVEEL